MPTQTLDVYGHFLAQVEHAISPGRLDRYMSAAQGDRRLALKLYVWNANICEAFYIPLKFAEIVTRNAMIAAIAVAYGDNWYQEAAFKSQIAPHQKENLARAIKDEGAQHGGAISGAHVASSLSFGFWVHLTERRFDHLLWKNGIAPYFPNVRNLQRDGLHIWLDELRQWRNRVAHYKTVFDKKPIKKMNRALDLVGLVCADTRQFVAEHTRVTSIVANRPRI